MSASEKLDVLRRVDRFRQWFSIDDQRRCLQCGRIFTGREVELIGGMSGAPAMAARCPTKGCVAIPLDWALVTGEYLFGVRYE